MVALTSKKIKNSQTFWAVIWWVCESIELSRIVGDSWTSLHTSHRPWKLHGTRKVVVISLHSIEQVAVTATLVQVSGHHPIEGVLSVQTVPIKYPAKESGVHIRAHIALNASFVGHYPHTGVEVVLVGGGSMSSALVHRVTLSLHGIHVLAWTTLVGTLGAESTRRPHAKNVHSILHHTNRTCTKKNID